MPDPKDKKKPASTTEEYEDLVDLIVHRRELDEHPLGEPEDEEEKT